MTARNPIATVGHKRSVGPGLPRYDVSTHLEDATVTSQSRHGYGSLRTPLDRARASDIVVHESGHSPPNALAIRARLDFDL